MKYSFLVNVPVLVVFTCSLLVSKDMYISVIDSVRLTVSMWITLEKSLSLRPLHHTEYSEYSHA